MKGLSVWLLCIFMLGMSAFAKSEGVSSAGGSSEISAEPLDDGNTQQDKNKATAKDEEPGCE